MQNFACVHSLCVCVCVRTHMLCGVCSEQGCVIGPSQGLVERSLHFMSFSPSLCIPSFPPPPWSIHTCPVTTDRGVQCSDSTRGSIRRDRISHRHSRWPKLLQRKKKLSRQSTLWYSFVACVATYVFIILIPPVYCMSQSVELFGTQDMDLLIWMLNFANTDYNWTSVFIC